MRAGSTLSKRFKFRSGRPAPGSPSRRVPVWVLGVLLLLHLPLYFQASHLSWHLPSLRRGGLAVVHQEKRARLPEVVAPGIPSESLGTGPESEALGELRLEEQQKPLVFLALMLRVPEPGSPYFNISREQSMQFLVQSLYWVEHMRYLGADRVFWLDFAMENPLLLKEEEVFELHLRQPWMTFQRKDWGKDWNRVNSEVATALEETSPEWVLMCTHPGQLLWVPGTPPAPLPVPLARHLRRRLLLLQEEEALLSWKSNLDPQGNKSEGQDHFAIAPVPVLQIPSHQCFLSNTAAGVSLPSPLKHLRGLPPDPTGVQGPGAPGRIPLVYPAVHQGQDPVLFRVKKVLPSWGDPAVLNKAMTGLREASRRKRHVSCAPRTTSEGTAPEGKAEGASETGTERSVHMRCGAAQEEAAATGVGHSPGQGFNRTELAPLVLISCISTHLPHTVPPPQPHTGPRPPPHQSPGETHGISGSDTRQAGKSGPRGVASSSFDWAEGGQLYEPWGATRGAEKDTVEAALQQVHAVQRAVHRTVLSAIRSHVRKGFALMDQYRTRLYGASKDELVKEYRRMAGREEIGINDLDDPTLGDLIKGGLLQQSDRAQPQQQQWPQQQQPITPPPAPDTNPDTNPESGFLAAVAINRVFSADQMRITSPHVWQWVEYYLYAGVDRIHWYDDAKTPGESQEETLHPYIEAGQVVHIYIHTLRFFEIDYFDEVNAVFAHFTTTVKDRYKWFLLCDVDEYMLLHHDKEPGFLARLLRSQPDSVSQVLFRNLEYGTPALPLPRSSLLGEVFRFHKDVTDATSKTKALVRSKCFPQVSRIDHPHAFPIICGDTVILDPDVGVMNHYWGVRATGFNPLTPQDWAGAVHDYSIEPFARMLRRRLWWRLEQGPAFEMQDGVWTLTEALELFRVAGEVGHS